MSYSGRYSREKEEKKRKKSGKNRTALWIAVGVVLGLILTAVVGAVMYVDSMLDLVRRPVEESIEPDTELISELIGNMEDETDNADSMEETVEEIKPNYSNTDKIINIMVVGQDYRKGEESKLSDTMILLTIDRETNTMTMTSFLRDMYIKLPNIWGHKCGKNRINTAYALGTLWKGDQGGMQMLDQLILEQFGTTVDYNVEIDFNGFVNIVNAIDGITIELNKEEANYLNSIVPSVGSFVVGENMLDGPAALEYARMRHASAADNDMNRTGRQRNVIKAVINKCRTMSIADLHNLLTELLPMVMTDMPNDVILSCAAELLPSIGSLKMESMQIPAEGTYKYRTIDISGVKSSVLVPDVEVNRDMLMAVAEADTVENP